MAWSALEGNAMAPREVDLRGGLAEEEEEEEGDEREGEALGDL